MSQERAERTRADIIGKKFGKLTPVNKVGVDKHGYCIWHCVCDCGNEIDLKTRQLKEKTKQDCGCMKRVRKDLTGMRFGKLVALYPVGKDGSPHIKWHCVCDCGNVKDIEGRRLVTGNTKSCGCINDKYIGKRYGYLTVLAKTEKRRKSGNSVMICRCDCGNIVEVATNALHSGNTKSCGCLRKKENLQDIKKIS